MTSVSSKTTNSLSKKARQIVRLAAQQGGRCFWCKREMILPGQPGYYRQRMAISRRGATLDHLYGFHHPLRRDPTVPRQNVAACDKCNRKRGEVEEFFRRHGKLEPRIYKPNETLSLC